MKSKHRQKRTNKKYKKNKSKKIKKIKYGGSNRSPLTNNNNLSLFIDDQIQQIWIRFADIEERIEALENKRL